MKRTNARTGSFTSIVAAVAALGVVSAVAVSGCGNPAVDDKIAVLGGEQSGVPQGPYHRPGQPCVLCHSTYYGASPELAVGGTVFADLHGFKPVENVQVVLTDSVGETRTAVTNCIGNFNIPKSSWDPQFPLAAEVRYPEYADDGTPKLASDGAPKLKVKAMGSYISRDGSCASCHTLYGRNPAVNADGQAVWYDTTGWIYLNALDETQFFPPISPTCIGKPPNDGSQGTGATTSVTTGGGT